MPKVLRKVTGNQSKLTLKTDKSSRLLLSKRALNSKKNSLDGGRSHSSRRNLQLPPPRGFKNRQESLEKLYIRQKYGLPSDTTSIQNESSRKALPHINSTRNAQGGSLITDIKKISPTKSRNISATI